MLKLELDLNIFILVYAIAVTLFLILYFLFDASYFVRFVLGMVFYKYDTKLKLKETGITYGVVTTSDIDLYLTHMNNARYVRELDFARLNFYERTGFLRRVMRVNGAFLQSASSIRYRKPIKVFKVFRIYTKLLYWDEKSLYLQHEFVTVSDNFVRAIAFCRQSVVGVHVPSVIAELQGNDVPEKPEPPEELLLWIKSNELSSVRLRKNVND